MKLNELDKLENIIDTIEFDPCEFESDHDDTFTIDNDDMVSLIDHIMPMVYDIVKQDVKIYHTNNYIELLRDTIMCELDNVFYGVELGCIETINLESLDIYKSEVCDVLLQYFYSIVPRRSHKGTEILFEQTETYKKSIDESMSYIYHKNASCPPQKSQEWHQQRYMLMSASTAWQVLDKKSYKDRYIYNKCKPLDLNRVNYVGINTPFHWGIKFEPISQMYYEYTYNTKIEEFGCIPHRDIDCMGASPDGIVVKRDCPRYGRMLEIKNIYNREITGIPKKEYWIQTQYQMECCNLNECDFLECRFKIYESKETFFKDGTFEQSKSGKQKGIIMCFYVNNEPFYEYMPYQCSLDVYTKWEAEMMEKHKNDTWVKNDYWFLDQVSCVLIQRNKTWFQHVKQEYLDIWETILYERIHGYEHRKPIKREKKVIQNNVINSSVVSQLLINTIQNHELNSNSNNVSSTHNNVSKTTITKDCVVGVSSQDVMPIIQVNKVEEQSTKPDTSTITQQDNPQTHKSKKSRKQSKQPRLIINIDTSNI